jgi:hypothetical protein
VGQPARKLATTIANIVPKVFISNPPPAPWRDFFLTRHFDGFGHKAHAKKRKIRSLT